MAAGGGSHTAVVAASASRAEKQKGVEPPRGQAWCCIHPSPLTVAHPPCSAAAVSASRPWALRAVFLQWFLKVTCIRSTWGACSTPHSECYLGLLKSEL